MVEVSVLRTDLPSNPLIESFSISFFFVGITDNLRRLPGGLDGSGFSSSSVHDWNPLIKFVII